MQYAVRKNVTAIEPYTPGLTDDELQELCGSQPVIKLNANENALGASPLAVEAISRELSSIHHYPDGGSELLRSAIARFHGVEKGHVLVGNGSDDIIKLLSETFLGPDDAIVVPTPTFSEYQFGASVMDAATIRVPLNEDFSYNIEALAEAVTSNTKLMYLCSPNNPTGTIMTAAQMDWLLHNVPASVVIVVDLAYNNYSSREDRVMETGALLKNARVVFLHTFSKLYGLAGLRVGYGLADPALWSFVHRVREPFNVNRVAQRAAAAALDDTAHASRSLNHVLASRQFIMDRMREFGLDATPSEANFVLIRTGDGASVTKFLMERGIMVRSGFKGLEEYIRVTCGTELENAAFVSALSDWLQKR